MFHQEECEVFSQWLLMQEVGIRDDSMADEGECRDKLADQGSAQTVFNYKMCWNYMK